ncbi:MAG: dienelactone hydrolase family protein [Devosia sp.]
MGERFKLTAADGFEFNAYRARPEGKVRGGVVLIQEVWGLNNWIRSVADRWARHGFLTIAPSLFDRVDYGFESENYGPDHFTRVGEVMKTFSMDKAIGDVEAAIAAASEAGKVGITGYCFGGRVSWIAASKLGGLSAASGYYGGGVPNYIDLVPQIPIEMHFADADKGIPLEQVEDLKAKHPSADIYVYPGDHGFCNSDRPDKFSEASCTKASARSLEFFHKHVG